MAVNSYDPVDGHPSFADTDAPDIKVDPTKVSEYAAFVGTRPIGTTAERTAYAYAREGLAWYDTDFEAEFVHDGTGWGRATPTLASAFNGTGTAQTFNSTPTDLTGLAFTLDLPATMNVRFKVGVQVFTDSLNAGVQLDLFDGASSIRNLFGSANGAPGVAGVSNTILGEIPVLNMAAGSHAIKVRATRTGSGTLTFPHTSLSRSFLIAEAF